MATMENLESDFSMAFVREALKQASRKMLMSGMNADVINKAFVAAVALLNTNPTTVRAITKTTVMEEAINAPVEKFIGSQTQKKLSETDQQFNFFAFLSLEFSPDGLSLSEDD